jgi:peptidoglycan LD-endopeptidase LytH
MTMLVTAVVIASVVAVGLAPSAVQAAESPPTGSSPGAGPEASDVEEEPGPTPEELAHERALAELTAALRGLRAAEGSLRGARGAAAGADGALRQGEERLVPALLARLEAEERIVEADRRLRAAERRVRRTEARLVALAERTAQVDADLEVARVQLEERVIRAYKTGSLAYESSLPLTVIREASSPGELATAIKHLATLMAVGLDHVEALVDELLELERETAATQDELELAVQERAAAADELAAAEAAHQQAATELGGGESRAAALRVAAYGAEARLLAAVAQVRSRQAELAAARQAASVTAAAAGEPSPDAATDVATDAGADEDADERASWWAGRERALGRARSLPAESRRTADDWVCPVDGASFINDWGFPRSHERRHEGTDVFAPLGTPIVAPTDAVVEKLDAVDRFDGRRDLGGVTVWLEQGRHRFYLAHLDSIHPDLRVGDEVAAGTVVGWVGRSGNARGTPPHLHLGWYVDKVAVNPYASLAVACSSDRPPLRVDDPAGQPRS